MFLAEEVVGEDVAKLLQVGGKVSDVPDLDVAWLSQLLHPRCRFE